MHVLRDSFFSAAGREGFSCRNRARRSNMELLKMLELNKSGGADFGTAR